MTPQIMRTLKKLYRFDNEFLNAQDEPCYAEAALSEKERSILYDYGWQVNDIVHFSGHSDILSKLQVLKNNSLLTKKRCLDAFVAGIGGSYPRGLSVLPAWYYLEHCHAHPYEEKTAYACCWVCGGHDKRVCINNAQFQYCLYRGNAYSSNPLYAYLNLKHLINVPTVAPTKDDIVTLSALLDLLRAAADDETPGKMEKRLRASKILKGDVYTKRGTLNTLAQVGIIPNQFISLSDRNWTNFGDIAICEKQLRNTNGRSDMVMPWAGWVGSLNIDETRVTELFGEYWNVFIS